MISHSEVKSAFCGARLHGTRWERGQDALVPSAVRRSVKQWRGFRPEAVAALAVEAGIPEVDHDHVVQYVGKQIRGLHEDNLIRYRLRPEDLAALEEG